MDKKFFAHICGALLIMLTLTACASPPTTTPEEREPVYYNDYLGLSITVPPGWQINAISDNLSDKQGQTAIPHLISYATGGGRLELIDIQNTAESTLPEHSRFYAYAEVFPEQVEVEQYMDLLAAFLQKADASHSYTLEKRQELSLARHNAHHICLRVDTAGQEISYNEEYFIVPLRTDFVVFYINYWPQNAASLAAALSVLDNISLPPPE